LSRYEHIALQLAALLRKVAPGAYERLWGAAKRREVEGAKERAVAARVRTARIYSKNMLRELK
jgi:hypothetical protein